MTAITNFNDLAQLHRAAKVKGPNSLDWIRFAETMADSFPKLYETARMMNAMAVAQQAALRNLLAQIELHTDCMNGQIDRSSLDDQVEAAEQLVGSWPEFKPPKVGAGETAEVA